MYASEVQGQRLTFFVSGKLWGRSLVMQDKETGSEWSHILGRAMKGPLKDASLEIIPSVMTDWKSWLATYPDTTVTVLPRTSGQFRNELLRIPSRFGLGLVHEGKARFWRFDRLQQQPLVNDELGTAKLVIDYDTTSRTAMAWSRMIPDQLLTFQVVDEQITDQETGSQWDLFRGIAITGPLKGTRLEAIPAIVSFSESWVRFHPDSSQWRP